MANSGIYINNQNNKRVVGSDTEVPRFIGKYNKSALDEVSTLGDFLIFNVSCPGFPLCFLSPPTGIAGSVDRILSTGTGQWDIYVYVANANTPVPDYNDYELYVFSGSNTSASSGDGMRIKKEDGTIAYDTGFNHLDVKLKLLNVPTNSTLTATSGSWSVGHGISKPAVLGNFGGIGISNQTAYVNLGFTYLYFPYNSWMTNAQGWYVYYNRDSFRVDTDGITIGPFPARVHDNFATYACTYNPSTGNYDCPWPDGEAKAGYKYGTFIGSDHNIDSGCVGDPNLLIGDGLCQNAGGPIFFCKNYFTVPDVEFYSAESFFTVFIIDGADYD